MIQDDEMEPEPQIYRVPFLYKTRELTGKN